MSGRCQYPCPCIWTPWRRKGLEERGRKRSLKREYRRTMQERIGLNYNRINRSRDGCCARARLRVGKMQRVSWMGVTGSWQTRDQAVPRRMFRVNRVFPWQFRASAAKKSPGCECGDAAQALAVCRGPRRWDQHEAKCSPLKFPSASPAQKNFCGRNPCIRWTY
jgi:hypothetical protein